MTTKHIVGIDIGGSHIKFSVYEINNNSQLEKNPIYTKDTSDAEMKKDLDSHTSQIVKAIFNLTEKNTILAVGIGSPGRFNQENKIKPGTNTNFGNTTDEFDNINLQKLYSEELQKKYGLSIPIYVENDGDVMLRGIIDAFMDLGDEKFEELFGFSKYEFTKKTISSFTIGTGVGNSYFNYKNGILQRINDGHASKILIPLDTTDLELFTNAWQRIEEDEIKQEIFTRDLDTKCNIQIRAEDLMRGPVIAALCRVKDCKDIELNNTEHLKALKFVAKYMAHLIIKINIGDPEDIKKENGWSQLEKDLASKAEIYFIGGGVGKSEIGKKITEYVNEYLQSYKVDIKVIQDISEDIVETYSAAKSAFEQIKPNKNITHTDNTQINQSLKQFI